MIVKTTKLSEGKNGIIPIGTEISGPESYRLVQLGVAVAVDDECKDKLAEIEAAKVAKRDRLNAMRPVAPPPVKEPPKEKPAKQEIK